MAESDSDSDITSTAVVIDNGSASCRAGFSSDTKPSAIFPSCVGRPRGQNNNKQNDHADTFVGEEAQKRRDVCAIRYPVEWGIVTNFELMEKLWYYTFQDALKIKPEEHLVFLVNQTMTPKVNKEKTTQIMFETFEVPGLYIGDQASMSMLASGHMTGTVVSSGNAVTHVVPVYEGYSLPHCVSHTPMAGVEIDYALQKMLKDKNYDISVSDARKIKESLCYASLDFEAELEKCKRYASSEEYYKLPDGHTIPIREERFSCVEAFFKTSIIGLEMPGLHELVNCSIRKADKDCQKLFASNIILSGGSTMFEGFPQRLQDELNKILPHGLTSTVQSLPPEDRILAPWTGGAIMASNTEFHSMCITKEDYDEYGPCQVHVKCFN